MTPSETPSFVVITSIQAITPSVRKMAKAAGECGMHTLIAADRKTPVAQDLPDSVEIFTIEAQERCDFTLAPLLPENHYARKNLGYLLALTRGAHCIFDTDDDNAPLSSWSLRSETAVASKADETGWVNVYRYFSGRPLWPRGFPLDHVKNSLDAKAPSRGSASRVAAPIQQGLVNGSPDVDAVWRLLMDDDVQFASAGSLLLSRGAWCPFNSQSTWWFSEAFPLLYLPSFVSFRMTDIWRSFIAQRCLWELGKGVVFNGAEMTQDRNYHNLLRDFEQEIPGYLGNDRIRTVLEDQELNASPGRVGENLSRCYEALVEADIIPARELQLVDAWLADLDVAFRGSAPSEVPK